MNIDLTNSAHNRAVRKQKIMAITVYGTTWCSDCKRSKRFMAENRIAFDWVDIEHDTAAIALIEKLNDGRRSVPTIVFEDGSTLVEPSNAELADKLGLQTKPKLQFYDLIVVGSGPAGLTAALYAAREGLDVLVIERSSFGGQAGITEQLDNFPGFPEGVSGAEFAERLTLQARRFGVELVQAQKVTGLRADGNLRYVATGGTNAAEYGASAVLISTGSTYKRLQVPGEEDFIGSGVHFCATCDGPFYRGRKVAVVGGGNSAGEESIFLTRFADQVTLLVRAPEMKASQIVIDKVTENARIDVRYNTSVEAITGDTGLRELKIHNSATDLTDTLAPDGLFVFIGQSPNSKWLPPEIERDEYGFVSTDEHMQTTVPGVFAAGDVRRGSTKQAASAAGEGASVALMIREYLKTV